MVRVLVVDDEEEIHMKSCSDFIIGGFSNGQKTNL